MTVQPLSKVLGKDHPSARRSQPAADNTEMPSMDDLVGTLKELFDRLDEAHDEAVRMAQEFADAEYAYEVAFTTARVSLEGGDGTAGYKDAKARQSAAEKRKAMTLAQELRRSARDAEENLRSQMSALQTVAAALRVSIELAGRGPTDNPSPARTG